MRGLKVKGKGLSTAENMSTSLKNSLQFFSEGLVHKSVDDGIDDVVDEMRVEDNDVVVD